MTEAIENRELTGAIARAKFAIESALDAYSRAADTVIEVGRLDKVEASNAHWFDFSKSLSLLPIAFTSFRSVETAREVQSASAGWRKRT